MHIGRYEVLDVAVLSDNSRFVSCGEDKAAFLWDVSTGVVVRRMQGHEQRINACCFSSEGSVLFTGSYDKVKTRAFGLPCNGRFGLFVFSAALTASMWLCCTHAVYLSARHKYHRTSLPAPSYQTSVVQEETGGRGF